MTTATATHTVSELAAYWLDTATPAEAAIIAKSKRAFMNAHGTGLLTTEELRGMYRGYVQQANERRSGEMYALAQAVVEAVAEVPFGTLSSWAQRQARKTIVCTRCGRKGTKKAPLLHSMHGYSHEHCDR